MKITVITLFPELFETFLKTSIPKRAAEKGLMEYRLIDLRQFGEGIHQIVDGRPFGGGPGMLLRADILTKALNSITKYDATVQSYVILTSASGKPYKQQTAQRLSKIKHLVIICGHYEGVDQRFIDKYVAEEISIGDYVLSGGEVAAQVIIDSIVRLIPGVLKKEDATLEESFSLEEGILEYPQYTHPSKFEDMEVPEVLVSGNHAKVKEWRLKEAYKKTKKIRPDLLKKL